MSWSTADIPDQSGRTAVVTGANGGLGYETTIRFNDTTQRVNNLVGDANTRIELGRGSVTLNQNAATTYQGKITGAGNLVKQGANTLTLSGLNAYYGATVVKQGALALTAGLAA